MVEILGCDLKRFFDTVDNPPKRCRDNICWK